jgi:hypothetical protein
MTGLATDYYTKCYMGRLWERDRDQLRTAENREAIRIRARFEPDRGNLSSVGWSVARDLNPGPHGPELCDLSSRNVGNDRFQFEISDPASLLVQNWVSLRPNYYMKYYRPGDRSCRRWPCPFSSA